MSCERGNRNVDNINRRDSGLVQQIASADAGRAPRSKLNTSFPGVAALGTLGDYARIRIHRTFCIGRWLLDGTSTQDRALVIRRGRSGPPHAVFIRGDRNSNMD